jgi:hypothetical protein
MQNAKDSFYMALRTRLATINPDRTILLRGTERPGIFVEEAEAPYSQLPNDVFVLRWTAQGVDPNLASAMVAAQCEVLYSTCGTTAYGGLDRGRALSVMDEELLEMLDPYSTVKTNYTVSPTVALLSKVFWSEPLWGSLVTQSDMLSRTVTVTVYSYQEDGE